LPRGEHALSNKTLGYLFVALSAAGFGLLSILIKVAYRLGAEPITLLAVRFLMATGLIWVIALVLVRPALRIGWRDLGYIALVGPLGVGYASVVYFLSLQLIDASLYAVLLYTYPAMVNAGSALFQRERLSSRRILSLIICFAGVVLATGLQGLGFVKVSGLGVVLGLTGAALYAAYNLGIQRQLRRHPSLVVNTYVMTFGALVALLIRPPSAWQGNLGWDVMIVIVAMVLFCTVAPIFLYLSGLKRIGAGRAAIVSNLEPLVTIVLALTFLSERLDGLQVVGMAAVLGGVLLLETES